MDQVESASKVSQPGEGPSSPASADAPVSPTAPRPELRRKRRRGWWWRFKWSVRGAALVALLVVFVVKCDRLFYYPDRVQRYTPAELNLKYEDVSFTTSDGVRLSGWFLPAAGQPRGTVVHFHGNAGNMTGHVAFVPWLPYEGYNVLVFDYRGYGKSEGCVSRAGTVRDGHAALDYVLSRPDVDAQRVYFFGQSIGGAVAIVVAAERPDVRAVAVDCTFGDYRRIAALHLEQIVRFRWLARTLAWLLISDGYDPIDVVAKISPRPLFVIASAEDHTCFPELSQELYERAAEPKEFWLVPGADHTMALDIAASEAERRIVQCFQRAEKQE